MLSSIESIVANAGVQPQPPREVGNHRAGLNEALRSHWARALLTGVAYLIGGQVDALMGTTSPAAIWPPNAVLLVALLHAPPSAWWKYLLAAAPADRMISWPAAPQWAAGLFAANALQCLLAAALLRWAWPARLNWRRQRFLLGFVLAAVVLAPAAAALIGGATVHALHPQTPLLAAWRQWWVANALTNLVLVPAISLLGMAAARRTSFRLPHQVPRVEAVLGSAALLLSCVAVCERPRASSDALIALFYVPLPFLLWAAVRFGPRGASGAIVLFTFIALHGASHGRGPFSPVPPAVHLFQLQVALIATALPVTFLAGAVAERGEAAAALARSTREARQAMANWQRSATQVQELAGRLIRAQEDERTRIARELHDDFSQRLAALSLGLSALKPHTSEDGRRPLARLQRGAVELAAEVRTLSHELHPGVLRHAGLTAALRANCGELDRRNGVRVAFAGDELGPGDVPPDAALCVYRVAQEALRNVARHAHARHARVILTADPGAVHLTVCDDGQGFDLDASRTSPGVGLASIEERVRLARGLLRIDARPAHGTELRVSVPRTC